MNDCSTCKHYYNCNSNNCDGGQIQVPDGCVTGEEFEKWLREMNINLTSKEIASDCQGILDMLNNDEE